MTPVNSESTNNHKTVPIPENALLESESSQRVNLSVNLSPEQKNGKHLPTLQIQPKTESLKPKKAGLFWGGMLLLLSGGVVVFTRPFGQTMLSNLSTVVTQKINPQPEETVPSPARLLPVQTIQVQPVQSYSVSRTYTGTVVARRSSALSFERSGTVVNITVNEGDRVERGTPLAYLDTRNLKAKQRQLLAQRDQAAAQLQELQAGARSHTIAAARAQQSQVMAQLRELQAGPRGETIAAAQASVTNFTQQLELAYKKLARRQGLYTEGAISREQLDEAAIEVSTLQAHRDQAQSKLNQLLAGTRPEQIAAQTARLQEAQSQLNQLLAGTRPEQIAAQQAVIEQYNASLDSLKIELEKSILKAPFSGTISTRFVDEGTVILTDESLFKLVENDAMEAQIGVPLSAIDQLQIGTTVPLQIGQKTYPSQILSILPELDVSTRTLTVVLSLPPLQISDHIFSQAALGQIAQLNLVQTIPTVGYWLPTTALIGGTRGLWFCYILKKSEDNQSVYSPQTSGFIIEQSNVEILHTESDRVLVRGTIQGGDQVVINGTHRLVPGQKVIPESTQDTIKSPVYSSLESYSMSQ